MLRNLVDQYPLVWMAEVNGLLVDLRDKIPRGLNSIDLMATIEPFYARFYIYQPGFPESLQHCCGNKPSSIIKVPVVDGRFCIRQSQPRDEAWSDVAIRTHVTRFRQRSTVRR
jgi:hypothetical protein